jgi:hypothetical protein
MLKLGLNSFTGTLPGAYSELKQLRELRAYLNIALNGGRLVTKARQGNLSGLGNMI